MVGPLATSTVGDRLAPPSDHTEPLIAHLTAVTVGGDVERRRAMGISHRKLASIEQAQRAAQFLAAGGSIADAVAGYYDQPQLTRAMRWATGHTPRELRAMTSFVAFDPGLRRSSSISVRYKRVC
ncbi:hypothetical protein ASD19_13740 [Microbacterium sp. Root53]|nr:hypothetical protein ASD19_13740 [Microbacterium sp. Root53]